MPFQDNPTIRPLYDTLEGGGPQAWKCLLCSCKTFKRPHLPDAHAAINGPGPQCGRITKTLLGMMTHQSIVHKFEPQLEIQHEEKSPEPDLDGTQDSGIGCL